LLIVASYLGARATPNPATAVSAVEPRIRLVYSREDFTSVPLPENVAAYSELRYMGSKHPLLPLDPLRGADFPALAFFPCCLNAGFRVP
jgi:hypothetical protein